MTKQMDSNFFIALEGVDGTGKSTVTKMLANIIGAKHMRTPSKYFDREREMIEKNGNQNDKFNFYVKSINAQQEEIEKILKEKSIICDRYICSTIAYQWPLNEEVPNNLKLFFKEIIWPDYYFLLTANESTRLERIKLRENLNGCRNEADYRFDIIEIAINRFLNMSELIKIDTSELTPADVCDIILKKTNN